MIRGQLCGLSRTGSVVSLVSASRTLSKGHRVVGCVSGSQPEAVASASCLPLWHRSRYSTIISVDPRRSLSALIARPLHIQPFWASKPKSSSSSESKPSIGMEEKDPGVNQGKFAKMKMLWNKYGVVFIITYGSVYILTLTGIYILISNKLLGFGDVIDLAKKTGLDKHVSVEYLNPAAGNFAAAWIVTKFTEPFRVGLSIALTPRLARALATFRGKSTANRSFALFFYLPMQCFSVTSRGKSARD